MVKSIFDYTISFLCLIVLMPILMVIATTLLFVQGFPILFKQERPGKNGEPFTFYKFRTMSNKKNKEGELLQDKDRITTFGSFLRKTSLDELPSLLNVLKGDMSLVGPRPLLVQYLSLYSKFQKRRHEVKPGITGWAQVNGRNSISWGKKFELDVWYVDNRTFMLDLKILFLTVYKVFKREGITAEGEATASPFTGNGES